ncbi:hypothetical protein DH26_gp096 [Chloriridovirus anopheles1]|uniref:Uncharacterized protein n=1 Tax=Chloriridovirus anopheles1 TaxID=1465751 RepID=W8QF46_9VIRU|nr:hypothetical protein DH26_gp096 [Anopheles minimus iridovirus]AHL67589.1 hypothetical protein AMIV_096 [Anopheles minimus iridovirus]
MSRNTIRARGDRDVYCGNNALNYDIINGTKLIGTRYQCFKKGVGAGLKEPILQPLDDYAPIDQTKIYCGKRDTLPADKDRFGTASECLRKGFGVGQKIKFEREGVQQTPIVLLTPGRPPRPSDEGVGGWYKVFLPTILGPVAGVFGPR